MNKHIFGFLFLIFITTDQQILPITRKSAAALTAAVTAGSFGAMWKCWYDRPFSALRSSYISRRSPFGVSSMVSLGTGILTGLVLYQYTPGPRYASAKSIARSVETNPLAALRIDNNNFQESLEISNCFDGTFAVPLIAAAVQLETLGIMLEQAEVELASAHDDEPKDTDLAYKIDVLFQDVKRMQKNVMANKRFIKLLPTWNEALNLHNQQIKIQNQTMLVNASNIHAQAAERSSWSLMFITIADWVRLLSGSRH